MIKDSSSTKMPIIICELLIEQMSEESCYNMKNMQDILTKKYWKQLYRSISNIDIEVTANYDEVYISVNGSRSVVAADLKTLAQTYLCSICSMSFSIENGLAWCNNYNNVSAQSACKSKAYLGSSILIDSDQWKLHISVFHSVIERKFDFPRSITVQNVIVFKLINKTFLFTIDRFNKSMEFVDNWQFHFITSL